MKVGRLNKKYKKLILKAAATELIHLINACTEGIIIAIIQIWLGIA